MIFCLIVEGLEKQFQLLCKTTLITLLADSAGNISLTFKTVNSEMFDLLMKLFETKDGYVIYSTEPAYSWAPQRGKAKIPCFSFIQWGFLINLKEPKLFT